MNENKDRTRLKADWFSITPPDENHDYWFLTFLDKTKKKDVHIEIEDMRKFKEELDKWIIVEGDEDWLKDFGTKK